MGGILSSSTRALLRKCPKFTIPRCGRHPARDPRGSILITHDRHERVSSSQQVARTWRGHAQIRGIRLRCCVFGSHSSVPFFSDEYFRVLSTSNSPPLLLLAPCLSGLCADGAACIACMVPDCCSQSTVACAIRRPAGRLRTIDTPH